MTGGRRIVLLWLALTASRLLLAQADTSAAGPAKGADSLHGAGWGRLHVKSEPADAAVFLDGMPVGRTPLEFSRRASDSLVVLIVKQFFEPWKSTVALRAGDTVRVMAVLRRIETQVNVAVADSAAVVSVDGQPVSTGSLLHFTLPPGNHLLRVDDSVSGRTVSRGILIGESQQPQYEARLGYRSFWRVVASAFVPGLAQCMDGAYLKGAAMFAATGAAAADALASANKYDDRAGQYNAALAAYRGAASEQNAIALRAVALARQDDANSAYRAKNVAYVIFGVAYALNIVDAVLNHMLADDIRLVPGTENTRVVTNTGVPAVSLRAEIVIR